MIRFLLFLTTVVLLVPACREDEFMVTTDTETFEPTAMRETQVMGRLVDDTDRPVAGVAVSWLDASTFTDNNGVFRLRAGTNQREALLRIEHPDYFNVSRRLYIPPSNQINNFKQSLYSAAPAQGFGATFGTTAVLSDALTLVFPPNAVATMDGTPYTGSVQIAHAYLDPTLSDIANRMPGDLTARNTAAEQRLLRSFGMAGVELTSDAGEPLQLRLPVELQLTVPDALLSDAPTTIPLWYFDEADGYWKEEGEAVLENNTYKGSVAHFTWWNCDVPIDLIFLELSFVPVAAAAGQWARLQNPTTGTIRSSQIDPTGTAAGYVPQDALLTLSVSTTALIGDCDQALTALPIGPFADDAVINDIPLDLIPVDEADTLSLKAIDCNGASVSLGYALVTTIFDWGTSTDLHPLDSTGCLFLQNGTCNITSDMSITLVDINADLESDPVDVTWSGNQMLGAVPVCGTTVPDQFTFELAGDTVHFYNTTVKIFDDPANNSTLLDITTTDLAPGGSVKYTIELRKWALSAFQWQISSQGTPEGNTPPSLYFFDPSPVNTSDVTISNIAALPGEQVTIEVTNVIVANPDAGFSEETTLIMEATVE